MLGRHRRAIQIGFIIVCLELVIFCSLGSVLFYKTPRQLYANDEFVYPSDDNKGSIRKQPQTILEEVPVPVVSSHVDKIEVTAIATTKLSTARRDDTEFQLPPQFLFNKPFYIYEELLWLNTTANEESVEDMIRRGYLWKHNDDLWFVNAALRHPMRTKNPEEAVLFVLPTFINILLSPYHHRDPCVGEDLCGLDAIYRIDEILGESPWFQRSQGKDHVVVTSIFSASKKLALLPNLVKCQHIALENRKWNRDDRYSVPSYYVGTPCLPRPKEFDFAMIASFKPQFTFDSRRNICEWLENDRPQYSVAACGYGNQCPALAQAKFGFHVRGDTYGANRLIDTILTGTVPIFTMKEQYEVLPDWIRWDDFSYFADVNDKQNFLRTLDEIVHDKALYQEKLANLMANRDLFDWQTQVPFDTYMYMFMAQIYPQYRRPDSDSPFGALQLSKAGGFDAFDSDKKQVWCGDSGPARRCEECRSLYDSNSLGCQSMCRWCEFGYKEPFQDNMVDTPGICVPLHYVCKEPDMKTVYASTVQPFRQIHDDEWCVPEESENDERKINGLLLAKTFKTGSSTAAAVTLQIANRVGKRKGFSQCVAHTSHDLSVYNAIRHRKAPSIAWTTVRDPAARALSSFAFYQAGKAKVEPTDENLIESLQGARHNQIAQLRINRGVSAPGGQPTNSDAFPESLSDTVTILREEIWKVYDFIAVTERMEESLVVMKLLWGLRDGDIMVSSIKQSGGWTFDWDVPETCFYVPKIPVSPKVQEYIDTGFVSTNSDYILHEVANRSLDATIGALGQDRVQRELSRHLRLKERALDYCRDHIRPPCSRDGKWQPESAENCLEEDIGCGYSCINDFLDKYEQGLIQVDAQSLSS